MILDMSAEEHRSRAAGGRSAASPDAPERISIIMDNAPERAESGRKQSTPEPVNLGSSTGRAGASMTMME